MRVPPLGLELFLQAQHYFQWELQEQSLFQFLSRRPIPV
jgi:hypothetical protein